MRANSWLPLGNFHSHPSTPARPSKEDIRLAYDPSASYLILSLAEEIPVLKAFGITGDVVVQQEIVIIS
jgi:proteasome lid subunit RPN8/RPN11